MLIFLTAIIAAIIIGVGAILASYFLIENGIRKGLIHFLDRQGYIVIKVKDTDVKFAIDDNSQSGKPSLLLGQLQVGGNVTSGVQYREVVVKNKKNPSQNEFSLYVAIEMMYYQPQKYHIKMS